MVIAELDPHGMPKKAPDSAWTELTSIAELEHVLNSPGYEPPFHALDCNDLGIIHSKYGGSKFFYWNGSEPIQVAMIHLLNSKDFRYYRVRKLKDTWKHFAILCAIACIFIFGLLLIVSFL